MKFVALVIGIFFSVGLQAQNIMVGNNQKGDSNTKPVKISTFKGGYGISKEKGTQTEVEKISIPTKNSTENQTEKVAEIKEQSRQAIRKSYYKAGYKVDGSHDTGYIPKASAILE